MCRSTCCAHCNRASSAWLHFLSLVDFSSLTDSVAVILVVVVSEWAAVAPNFFTSSSTGGASARLCTQGTHSLELEERKKKLWLCRLPSSVLFQAQAHTSQQARCPLIIIINDIIIISVLVLVLLLTPLSALVWTAAPKGKINLTSARTGECLSPTDDRHRTTVHWHFFFFLFRPDCPVITSHQEQSSSSTSTTSRPLPSNSFIFHKDRQEVSCLVFFSSTCSSEWPSSAENNYAIAYYCQRVWWSLRVPLLVVNVPRPTPHCPFSAGAYHHH